MTKGLQTCKGTRNVKKVPYKEAIEVTATSTVNLVGREQTKEEIFQSSSSCSLIPGSSHWLILKQEQQGLRIRPFLLGPRARQRKSRKWIWGEITVCSSKVTFGSEFRYIFILLSVLFAPFHMLSTHIVITGVITVEIDSSWLLILRDQQVASAHGYAKLCF